MILTYSGRPLIGAIIQNALSLHRRCLGHWILGKVHNYEDDGGVDGNDGDEGGDDDDDSDDDDGNDNDDDGNEYDDDNDDDDDYGDGN